MIGPPGILYAHKRRVHNNVRVHVSLHVFLDNIAFNRSSRIYINTILWRVSAARDLTRCYRFEFFLFLFLRPKSSPSSTICIYIYMHSFQSIFSIHATTMRAMTGIYRVLNFSKYHNKISNFSFIFFTLSIYRKYL